MFDASYLVLGLGDVYLGAPVATPLDPRHRLVTTKYNPARTGRRRMPSALAALPLRLWDGGSGRVSIRRANVPDVEPLRTRDGTPWLLRFFDQLRFYPVSEAELLSFRDAFARGRATLDSRRAPSG